MHTRKQHLAYLRRTIQKFGVEDLIARTFAPKTDFFHQIAVCITQTTSIMEPLWIETIDVPDSPKQVHQPQHNHGRTDHGLKQIYHGKVIGNIMGRTFPKLVGPMREPHLAVATSDQQRYPMSKSQQCRNAHWRWVL